jgi:hypothetical protein
MIFDMYVNEDLGRNTICSRLEEMHIKPPKGRYWSPAALKDMLQNVHYIGKVKWNWRKTVNVVQNQVVIKTRPKSTDYLIFDGKHEGIVSEDLFAAAQAKQGRNHRAKPSTKIRNPFASLLYCRCGRAMSYRTYRQPDGSVRSEPRLLCDDQVHCHTASVTYREFMERVCKIMEDCIADFRIRLAAAEKQNSAALYDNMLHSLEKKMAALEEKELRQWEKYADGEMPRGIFEKLNAAVVKEKDEVQRALDQARSSVPVRTEDYERKIALFSDALYSLRSPDVPDELKNRYLKQIFCRITYSRDKPDRSSRGKCIKLESGRLSLPFVLDVKFL